LKQKGIKAINSKRSNTLTELYLCCYPQTFGLSLQSNFVIPKPHDAPHYLEMSYNTQVSYNSY